MRRCRRAGTCQRTVGKGEHHGGGVLHRVAARRVRDHRLPPDHGAQQGLQVVHLVDEVEQDRPAPGLPPPTTADVEVVVRLVEQRRAHDGDDRAQHAAVHDLPGSGHDRAVVPVVPRQQRDARRLGRLDQPGGALDAVAERLLDDHRHAGRDALQAAVDVQRVGRGEDDAIGLVLLEQLGQRPVQGHPERVRHLPCRRNGIDDGRDLCRTARVDLLEVPLTDEPGPRHGDPNGDRHRQFPWRESWYRPLIARV